VERKAKPAAPRSAQAARWVRAEGLRAPSLRLTPLPMPAAQATPFPVARASLLGPAGPSGSSDPATQLPAATPQARSRSLATTRAAGAGHPSPPMEAHAPLAALASSVPPGFPQEPAGHTEASFLQAAGRRTSCELKLSAPTPRSGWLFSLDYLAGAR